MLSTTLLALSHSLHSRVGNSLSRVEAGVKGALPRGNHDCTNWFCVVIEGDQLLTRWIVAATSDTAPMNAAVVKASGITA